MIDIEKYHEFKELLCLSHSPLAIFYTGAEPEEGTCPPEGNLAQPVLEEYVARGEIAPFAEVHRGVRCVVSYAARVLRKGGTAYFDRDRYGCIGASYYLGFDPGAAQASAYAISTGFPGVMEGEHICSSPEEALAYYSAVGAPAAPAPFLVIKRLEDLGPDEEPGALAFLEEPDVIAGIVGLLAYTLKRPDSVISPFGSGCSSLVTFPMKEAASDSPRAVLGMFDVTARPDIDAEAISISMPAGIFSALVEDMNESFLRGHSWKVMAERISRRRGSRADS